MTSAYARTDSGGGGKESQDNPTGGGGWKILFFLAGNRSVLLGAFGQPAFFLAGNRMTIVAFEKEVSLKSLAKGLLDSTEVLNLRKAFNICQKWKEKDQKNTGGWRKVQVLVCFLQRRACPVLKHNQVSEVFKGLKVSLHDFEYYGQRNYVLKWKFNLCQ